MCLPPLTAQRLMAESQTLAADCPETLARLEDGRLTYGQAQAVARVVAGLGGEDRERVEQMMLGKAKDLTAAQLERIGRRHRDALLTEAQLTRQHRQARAERSVWLRPEPEGMVQLCALVDRSIPVPALAPRLPGRPEERDAKLWSCSPRRRCWG